MGAAILLFLYLGAFLSDFVGPYGYLEQVRGEPSAPASSLHFVDEQGSFHLRPFIYPVKLSDARSLTYEEVTTRAYPLSFFVRGAEYSFLGLLTTDLHVFGIDGVHGEDAPHVRILGSDQLGRDKFSRLLRGMRFSLLVTPAGAFAALVVGLLVGGISGYSNRTVDSVLMGITDTVIALPALILILAARAAFPLELSATSAAVMLIGIFGLTGWGEMSRLVRGLVWSLRHREFVLAARATGASEARILTQHVGPNIARPVLIQATLMLPAFLLTEVAMSFLGVGVQDPEPSLGNVLGAAADLIQIQQRPLGLIAPVVVIMLYMVAFRLVLSMRK